MEPCWGGEGKVGVPHCNLTPRPHFFPAGLGLRNATVYHMSPRRWHSLLNRGWPRAEQSMLTSQSCSENHLCKKKIFPQEWEMGVGGAKQYRHCCEAGFG